MNSDYDWNSWVDRMLQKHFRYGRAPIERVLCAIAVNVQTVWNVYRNFPDTAFNLLEQVKSDFTKDQYEHDILNPIKFLSIKKKEFEPLAESLSSLRMLMGDYPELLKGAYPQEIASLPVEQKFNTFQLFAKEALVEAVEDFTAHVRAKLTQENANPAKSAVL